MGWLEDAKNVLADLERFDAKKRTGLIIKSTEDLRDCYAGIKSLTFRIDYSGPSIESILPSILEKSCDLNSLHIFTNRLSWKTICSLNLSHIQDLTFNLEGDVTPERLVAPCLKKLSIFGTGELTPIELMLHPVPHIDFSGMNVLENLELRHFQQVDPTDFQNVKTLKRLVITYSNIENLDWLKRTSYSLDTLCFDGPIDDCGGVVYQSNLKELCLYHSHLADVSPIENLQSLRKLDLRYGTVTSEGNLRSMGIEELTITREDDDYLRIRTQVKGLVRTAVMHYQLQNKQLNKINELPELRKRILLRATSEPFDVRLQHLIQMEFNRTLKEINDDDKTIVTSISKEDYLKLFVEETIKYCPFVSAPRNC